MSSISTGSSSLREHVQKLTDAASNPAHPRLQDLQQQLLHSGLAVYTGSCDQKGSTLVLVFCKHSGWHADHFATTELARLILYYHSLHRLQTALTSPGLALIIDARGTTLPVLNAVLTTIHAVEAASPEAINIVHMLTDRIAQSLIFRSSIFKPSEDTKINIVTNMPTLYRFVQEPSLPGTLGGTLNHSHQQWLAFRRDVELFQQRCLQAATFLVRVMAELAASTRSPLSVAEAQNDIDRHVEAMLQAEQDPCLLALQQEGTATLEKLQEELAAVSHCHDCRESLASAEKLHSTVQTSMIEVKRLGDRRRHLLEQSLRQCQFQQQASQLVSWLENDGEVLLKTYLNDELTGTPSSVQQEFQEAYTAAKKQLSRGRDLLEEANNISRCGSLSDIDGIKEVAQELKTHMNTFSEQLEGAKSTIANNAHCQNLLDKCYHWALETMKYIKHHKDESSTSLTEVQHLLSSLDLYLEESPPISEDNIQHMLHLARQLDKPQLLERCHSVRTRCREASDLLAQRRGILEQRLHRLQQDELRFSRPHAHTVTGYGVEPEAVWPADFSSPHCSFADIMSRRRSYAGKPSAPLYSPAAAAFRANVRDLNLTEYEEHLFSEGLITEDMSDRIVTSLPKGLSDCTLRSSRESLRGSRESLGGSTENIYESVAEVTGNVEVSSSMPSTSSSYFPSSMGFGKTSSIRRATPPGRTSNMEKEYTEGGYREVKRNSRPLSMRTGSTESLPSMPEEEEEEEDNLSSAATNGRSQGQMWAPALPPTRSTGLGQLKSFRSVSDLRLADDEVKRRKTLAHVMHEILQTEQDYVRSLGVVVDHYIPELSRDDVPQPLQGKRNLIFSNLEKIYQFHQQYFLQELSGTEDAPLLVARCFLRHFDDFYLYALYNKAKPKSDELLADHGARFFKRKQMELQDQLDLSSYLLKPVQRLGKYALLLKQVSKECPATHPEFPHLQRALEMVRFLLRHGNDLLAMDSLRDCDVSLQEQGRLIRQEEFVVWQGRKKSIRRVFLFEELIVFSKPRRSSSGHDVYSYKNSIKMADVGLTENIGGRGLRFEVWFRKLRSSAGTFTLQAANMEVKESWVRDLSKLLWRQAIKNRELRRQEMAQMGIGSKPGMDIKPSKNNIQDRSVHPTRYQQVPRFRNSIAVSSVEHLRNGSKRPHSIISISSSSSSSSSGGATYYSRVAAPRSHPMPTSTASSVESGFVSDLSSSSSVVEDAFTQTTIRRPVQHQTLLASTFEADGAKTTSSHLLGTDV